MFNIGFAELLLILFIAVFIVGPKDLPKVARGLGRAFRWLKHIISEVKGDLGLDVLEKEFKGIETEVHNVQNEIKKSTEGTDLRQELKNSTQLFQNSINDIKRETRLTEPGTPSHISSSVDSKPLGFQDFKMKHTSHSDLSENSPSSEEENTSDSVVIKSEKQD